MGKISAAKAGNMAIPFQSEVSSLFIVRQLNLGTAFHFQFMIDDFRFWELRLPRCTRNDGV
jgi:hypothetical protein